MLCRPQIMGLLKVSSELSWPYSTVQKGSAGKYTEKLEAASGSRTIGR